MLNSNRTVIFHKTRIMFLSDCIVWTVRSMTGVQGPRRAAFQPLTPSWALVGLPFAGSYSAPGFFQKLQRNQDVPRGAICRLSGLMLLGKNCHNISMFSKWKAFELSVPSRLGVLLQKAFGTPISLSLSHTHAHHTALLLCSNCILSEAAKLAAEL